MIIISRIGIFMGNFWSKIHKEGRDWIPTTLLFSSFHVVGMVVEPRFASVFMRRGGYLRTLNRQYQSSDLAHQSTTSDFLYIPYS